MDSTITETTPTETPETTPTVYPGSAFVTILNSLDAYDHWGVVTWRGDEVTITRKSSGSAEEVVTSERDVVTEDALLGMIAPNVHPPEDFGVMILANDSIGTWRGRLSIRVEGGKAEIVPLYGPCSPAPIPMWFLSVLRDLVFVDDDEEGV